MTSWLGQDDEVDTENPDLLDPVVEGPDADKGLEISKIPFDELVKRFPNTEQVSLFQLSSTLSTDVSIVNGSYHCKGD